MTPDDYATQEFNKGRAAELEALAQVIEETMKRWAVHLPTSLLTEVWLGTRRGTQNIWGELQKKHPDHARVCGVLSTLNVATQQLKGWADEYRAKSPPDLTLKRMRGEDKT